MRVTRTAPTVKDIPVDFFADPDGSWEFEGLARRAGFDERWGDVLVGALTKTYEGFPEGAAVVTLTTGSHCSVALVDCTTPEGRTRVWS
jgi:hypothetical protein